MQPNKRIKTDMKETRYVIKITPSDKYTGHWPCDCEYAGVRGGCSSNLYPSETKENLYNYAYKTYKGAEFGYKRQLGKWYSMPLIDYVFWWEKVKLLPKKERDRILLERYEMVKDKYVCEIMTVDEAWEDWTKVYTEFRKRH